MARYSFLGITVERRMTYSRIASILTTVIAIGLAFAAVAGILTAMRLDTYRAFGVILAVFITPRLLLQAILRGLPIILATLGLAIAFRMNFWNIGAEGQIYWGMIAATGVVLAHVYYGYLPDLLVLPTMLIASFIAGGVWCLIPAILKAKLNVNEILTTLMMNYIAAYFVDYLIYGPWRDPHGYGFPLSIPFPKYAKLTFVAENPSYTGLILSIILAAMVYIIFRFTKLGFELRVIGENLDAARYAGITIPRVLMLGSFLSGGLAGLGGLAIVSGIIGRLRPRASPGYGYTAIIVAWLAALNPWLIIPAGIFFGGLLVAGESLQATLKIPNAAVQILQGIIFLFIILGEFLKRYKISFGGGRGVR